MPPNAAQKDRLRKLEARLRKCLKTGETELAIEITADIQGMYSDDRGNHRLLKAKLWCFETSLLANRHAYAESGLLGIVNLANSNTKIRLEAQVLLAICYIRQKRYPDAKNLIQSVMSNINDIGSDRSRRLFQKKFMERLEEECVLSELIGVEETPLDAESVQDKAVFLLHHNSNDEILAVIAASLPEKVRLALTDVRAFTLLQMRGDDVKLLGSPTDSEQPKQLGSRTLGVLKRIAWRSFCAPDSAVYKAWSKKLPEVFGQGYMAASLVATFKDWRIGIPLLASGVLATIMKSSACEFCEWAQPESFMTSRADLEKHEPAAKKKTKSKG
jgi:hypothetical protein